MDEMKWIPCSERLPEPDVPVLATIQYKEEGCAVQRVVGEAEYNGYGKMWTTWDWNLCELACVNYLAWMPMPEPYKG